MGYRLNVKDLNDTSLEFYGTKLYGYYKETELESYKYLKSLGKVTEETMWDYCFENKIILTCEEFNIFIKLYAADFKKEAHINLKDYLDYDILKKIKKTKAKKELTWL